jgi:hypothetical protein
MSNFSDPIAHLQEPLIFRDGEPFAFLFDFSGNTPVINVSSWVPTLEILSCDGELIKEIPAGNFTKPQTDQLFLSLDDADLDPEVRHRVDYLFKLKIVTDQPKRTFIDGVFKRVK